MEWNKNIPSPWDWNNLMEQVEVDNGASVFVNASSSKEKDDEASSVLVSDGMMGPIDQVIGLKLGKRTYFEDVCAGGSVKTSSSSSSPPSTAVPATKKSGATHHRSITPRCQVEGCNLDLSSVKDYYCRHRVCVSHSKFPKVVVAGLECRFCQQCSRFHGLLEFDENKRSCRRRLTHHNARRRKPQPVAVQYNLGKTSSSMSDAREQTSLPFHRLPFTHTRPELLSQGIEETSDVRPVPYRLSNYQWLTGNTESHCVNHHMNANYTPMADSTMHAVPQGLPEYWQTEHQPGGSEMQTLACQISGGNCFEEFQLLKAPFESGLCSDQMN